MGEAAARARPKLYVFGESLGTFGGEAAFSGLADIQNRTDGVLWAGPPNFNDLWRGIVADRQSGSPEWLPVVDDGRTVRFADEASDLAKPPVPGVSRAWSTCRTRRTPSCGGRRG